MTGPPIYVTAVLGGVCSVCEYSLIHIDRANRVLDVSFVRQVHGSFDPTQSPWHSGSPRKLGV